MTNLKVFDYNNTQIRTVEKDGEMWWVLKDVCEALELSNPTVVAGRLDSDEVAKFDLGRQGEINIISESGLYNVILRSDKPQAKDFKRWVTHDVLPTLRRTGTYSIQNYPKKSTSAGEVASLVKRLDDIAKCKKCSGQERSEIAYAICNQFDVRLPECFAKRSPYEQLVITEMRRFFGNSDIC